MNEANAGATPLSKPLSDDIVDACAARLLAAERSGVPIPKLTGEMPTLSVDDGYRIQRALVDLRLLDGEQVTGFKMGLTSKAKMEQMGVRFPIYGRLLSSMRHEDGEPLVRAGLCHPRVEPEVAFILGAPISGRTTAAEALAAVAWVCPALEVIDSRYQAFQFTLPDVVADNTSGCRYVLGPCRRRPEEVDLGNLGMVFRHNGAVVHTASSAAVYDHPARSFAMLVNLLDAEGTSLKAGQVVLTGGATPAVAVAPGDFIEAEIASLGSVRLPVVA